MSAMDEMIWCDGCGVEIYWAPLMVKQNRYCCRDCQRGWECRCGERSEMADEPRRGRERPSTPAFFDSG